jgi:Uma2 family endonuclease
MTSTLPKAPLAGFTLAEWYEFRDRFPEFHVELEDGLLIVTPPPMPGHAVLVMRIAAWLIVHGYPVDQILAEAGMRAGANARIPDLMLLASPADLSELNVPASQVILAVEVVSHTSGVRDKITKRIEYADAGVGRYWVVEGINDPDGAFVTGYVGGTREFHDMPLAEILAGTPADRGL